jgi:pimeloyl-ACP methyl ester carboxylesterase
VGADPPVVVCLHGLGRSPADWDGVRAGLDGLGEVRAPALPRNPRDALTVAGAAIPDGAIVIGHSIGGVLALRLSAEGERHYRALVLTDSFFPPARNGRATSAAVRDYLSHRVAYLRELRSTPAPRSSAGPRSDQVAALAGLVRLAVRRSDFDAAAAGVSAPVLVVHARDDHHVPIDFALAAAARDPSWQLETLASGGHHAHVTRPEAWSDAVLPWLRTQLV